MVSTSTDVDDVVVLVDDDGSPVGTAARSRVHTTDTPLHLAFSLYLHDGDGRVLLTRRALGKVSWPGVWTNTCCGHLRPGETPVQAAVRRVRDELGVTVDSPRVVLPAFRYRAVDAHGIVENEICPVLTARLHETPRPNPDEVAETGWVNWPDLVAIARAAPALLSPWSVAQLRELAELEHLWPR